MDGSWCPDGADPPGGVTWCWVPDVDGQPVRSQEVRAEDGRSDVGDDEFPGERCPTV